VTTTFILGAGSSFGTLNCRQCYLSSFPPTARDFGKILVTRFNDWRTRFPGLAGVVEHLGLPMEEAGLEEIWTWIDYSAKFNGNTFSSIHEDPAWNLKCALVELYGRMCDDAIERIPKL